MIGTRWTWTSESGALCLGLTELQEAEVSRVARHPTAPQQQGLTELPQVRGRHDPAQGVPRGVLPHLVRVDHATLHPASQDDDGLAHRELGVPVHLYCREKYHISKMLYISALSSLISAQMGEI